jgi:DNA-binding LacI/PurR family transcriptional regulator
VPEFANPVFAALAEAMETHAARAGLATILCNTHGSARRELDYVRMLLERRVEGMVFISAEVTDIRGEHLHYVQLLERGARLVFVNGGSEELEVTTVGVDERAAGRIATEHLLELGHRRIGFVGGVPSSLFQRERLAAFRRTLVAAGVPALTALEAETNFTEREGYQRALELLGRAPRPTALLCSNDVVGQGALAAAHKLGLRVPADLSLVSLAGLPGPRLAAPALATVIQDFEQAGAMAATLLLKLIGDQPTPATPALLPAEFAPGDSTAPPPSG